MPKPSLPENLNDLDALYAFWDDHAHEFDNLMELASHLEMLEKKNRTAGDESKDRRLSVESCCVYFEIRSGKFSPISTWALSDGTLVNFPDICRFTSDDYDYIQSRLEKTKNPVLKARYAHILWEGRKKHDDLAGAAAENYFEAMKLCREQTFKNPEEQFWVGLIEAVGNTMFFVHTCGVNLDGFFEFLLDLLRSDIPEKERIVLSVSEAVNDFPRAIPREGLSEIYRALLQGTRDLMKASCFPSVEQATESLERTAGRLGENPTELKRLRAEAYEAWAWEHANAGNSNEAHSLFADAAAAYKELRDYEKAAGLELLYKEHGKKMHFGKIEHETDITAVIELAKSVTNHLLDQGPEAVLTFLMNDKSLLPDLARVREATKKQLETNPFLAHIRLAIIDEQGNEAKKAASPEETFSHWTSVNYGYELGMKTYNIMHVLLFEAIKKRVLGTGQFVDFLLKTSWLGRRLKLVSAQGETIEYSWLEALLPAVHDYFTQMSFYFHDDRNQPYFMLALDSLTVKIEGMLRDLCRLFGRSTMVTKKDGTAVTTQEKNLYQLLEDEVLKGKLGEDLVFFLKFVLIDKSGLGLRDRLAHGLMLPREYSVEKMHYLLLAALRLGAFQFLDAEKSGTVTKKDSES